MYMILLLFWFSTVFVIVTIRSETQNEIASANICTTESCMQASAQIRKYMDEIVNPCDDFYQFACGKFSRETPIPQDKSSVTSFSLTQDKVDEQLRDILTEEPQPNETKAVKLAKIFMKTCMDEATLNQNGITPLADILEKFGGWPVVKGDSWKSDGWDWLETSKKISRDGLGGTILESFVSVDFKNTSKRIMSISRASFGLSRKFLLKGMEHAFVKAYYDFMVDAAVIFGANQTNAETESLDILRFEMELAKVSLSDEESRNKSLTYNPFTIKELQTTFPFINWLEFINWELRDLVHVDENEVIVVIELNYLSQLNGILQSTPKRTIANYYAWRLFLSYSEYLNDVLHERHEKYLMAITGKQKSLPRLTECVRLTVGYLSISVGASYVRKYFNEQTKQVASLLTKTIHEEFIETLQNVPWMDEKSRAAAKVKANNMHFHVAFPHELVDDEKLEKYYHGLELQPYSLLHNLIQIHKFFEVRSINKLRQPVNKTDWETHSLTTSVNAFYSPPENSIQLPAAVLQSPFFSAERPAYLNFAAIGWFIAHEITHGFDDEGRQFDSDGNVMNWWQEDTIEKFTNRAQCFIQQYSNFKHPTLNLTVNGVITQGENIADNGAVKVAYESYQRFSQLNGPEANLPELSFTPNQLFWISAAQIWCSVSRPEFDTMHYTTNVHAPNEFRVIGTFQNSAHFAHDFNCSPGTTMNPIKSQKCEIW